MTQSDRIKSVCGDMHGLNLTAKLKGKYRTMIDIRLSCVCFSPHTNASVIGWIPCKVSLFCLPMGPILKGQRANSGQSDRDPMRSAIGHRFSAYANNWLDQKTQSKPLSTYNR